MTDTGQVPGEGLPENAGMVEQPGVLAPGAYTFLDPSENPTEDDDLLLMPGAQGAWGNEVAPPAPQPLVHEPLAHEPLVHEPGPHETAGRDSGSVDLSGVRVPNPAPAPHLPPPRRPLHLGPPTPDGSASPVRSLADRGPAAAPLATPAYAASPVAPVRQAGPPTVGPEYLDVPQLAEIPPQGAVPWGAPPVGSEAAAAETVVPGDGQGSEAVPVAEPGTVAETAAVPVAEVAGAPEAAEAAGLGSALQAPEAPEGAGLEAAPQVVPEVDHSPEAAEGHLAVQTPESAQGAEAAYALDGSLDLHAPQLSDATPFPAAQEVPHAVPPAGDSGGDGGNGSDSGDEVAEHVTDVQGVAHATVPAQVSADEEHVAPEQNLHVVQDPQATPAALQQVAEEAAHLADPQVHLADPSVHLADPAGPLAETAAQVVDPSAQAVDPAPQFPVQAAQLADAGVHIMEPVAQFVDAGAEADAGADGGSAGEAARSVPAPGPLVADAPHASDDAQAQAALSVEASHAEVVPGVEAFPVQAAQFMAPAEAHAAFAEAGVPVGVAVPAQAPQAAMNQMNQSHGEHLPGGASGAAGFQDAPLEPAAEQPVGQFVPVEGTVPTTPHLAPTPPHPMTVPPLPEEEQPPAEEPVQEQAPVVADAAEVAPVEDLETPTAEAEAVTSVPAPRKADTPPVPEPLPADPEPVVAQQAEDLDTRVADQEESTAVVEDVRESTGPAAPGYDDVEREAVLRVMRERRDIRNGFRSDPIPHDVLLRVLEAAHTAPSVGHSQPWDFVVIRSADTRRSMHELAARQRDAYAKSLPKGRAKQFKELKIEAILDTPVNIVVTADPTRGGRHTLGRHTQPQMAPYSSALAVENLWLAARAEGLGVGWVSFFDEREMVRALGLPEHLEVVAYLCVGYVDEFPDEPELMQAGWSKRRPLSWVVHEETYGRRALPGEEPHDLLAETVSNIRPLDAKALGEAWERQKRMTKPAGALGMLEIISAQLSGLSRMCPPPIPEPAAVAIFAGDHGVHAQGVTPWPQEVTAQMVANFLGGGAVCNAFANQVGAEVCVIDVGVASDLPATPGLLPRKIRPGTADMTTGPAMTREEVIAAIEVGIETARDLVAAGNKALLTGEMGIANTTASAALISIYTDTDPSEVTGRGTGINDETLARKTEVVRRAIELHQPDPADPIGVLAAVGGLEHAAMVGLLLGGASLRTPVILDGVSAGAAALVARAVAPEVLAACIAGHRSAEPGHVAALNKLGLRPLVDLDLRLGEGTGALLALPVVQSAARAMHEVATFDSAGVTEK
ncbi:nicotinate-nucleotide--dimethylbenzimidazole phosphoribosyltransferase [Streptomyces sp. NPDC048275]|uniref:nicotinate-nucleotide--dimethylbenzimidazole phosphoribosyltransferase n=1 Tax=Streptomyces sp. NPDC048275 TaxID=3155629 RepID=UPI0033F34D21